MFDKKNIDLLISEFISGNISKERFIRMYIIDALKIIIILIINNDSFKDDDLNSTYGVIIAKKI